MADLLSLKNDLVMMTALRHLVMLEDCPRMREMVAHLERRIELTQEAIEVYERPSDLPSAK